MGIESLICSCCGTRTEGRQWFNRDAGYGICPPCADRVERCEAKANPTCRIKEIMRGYYGEKGIHYAINPEGEKRP